MGKQKESKAKVNKICATSRVTVKMKDNYYSMEYTEERLVPEDCDIELERSLLWETVNLEVDRQAEDVLKMCKGDR